MRSPTDVSDEMLDQFEDGDTLDLIERRYQTATLPVSAEHAQELFARFLKDSQAPHMGSFRYHFSPLGAGACLMHCEQAVAPGEADGDPDAAARIVTDFREYVASVSSRS